MSENIDLESYIDQLDKQFADDDDEMTLYDGDGVDVGDDDVAYENDDVDIVIDNDEDNGDNENEESMSPEKYMNDDDIDDDELEDGTIFMDAEGNYYYQSGKKAVPVKPVSAVKKRKRNLNVKKEPLTAAMKKKSDPPLSQLKLKSKQNSTQKETTVKPSLKKSPAKSLAPASSKKSTAKTLATYGNSSSKNSSAKTPAPYGNSSFKEPEKPGNSHLINLHKPIKVEPTVKVETWDISLTSLPDESVAEQSTWNEDEVYEFNETEQTIEDPEDPDDPNDPDYTVDTSVDEGSDHRKETEAKIKPYSSMLKEVSEGRFQCTICSYKTEKRFLLSRHLKTHSDERPFKCQVCDRGFKTNISLINHTNTHSGKKPHKCADCDKAFTTSGELTRHRRYRHTGVKPHKCTECNYSSVELSKLRRHMRCHTGERPYQCPHCTYASPDTFKLKRHMRTHTGEKPYECDICKARFTQSNSLKYHRLIHSVNDKPVFQCNLCPTTCGRKNDLRLHIQKQHNQDNPVTCKRCGKVLPDRYSYKMHAKTHEGEKCYRCEFCPYASISMRHLHTHMLLHTDSKPFKCEECEQSFRQKQLLMRHVKIYHTQDYQPPAPKTKAHRCPHCERSFAFNGNLIRHMATHDPNSKHYEEKHQLRIGRMKRVQPDGTIVTKMKSPFVYPYDGVTNEDEELEELELEESEEEENEEQMYEDGEEIMQYIYDEYMGEDGGQGLITDENQPMQLKQETPQTSSTNNITHENIEQIQVVKQENNNFEIMETQVDEDLGYMVIEVMPEEDEDNTSTQFQIKENVRREQNPKKKSSSKNTLNEITSDCFGFDDDAEADEYDDDGSREFIQMLSDI